MATFSRMEYALKAAGYALGSAQKVESDWDRFANEIHEQFSQIETQEITEAKTLLLNNPPRKQVLKNERLVFQNQVVDQNQRNTQQIIRFVRTVRNNLFHGGKYIPNGEQEVGRNEALVNASLLVLKTCLELNAVVKHHYEN
ncbi:MAG: hypothetical protein EOO07_21465 [Chitinophagaceae bacterium]|nr:MAG: hypothetical protein EOO07_21465 [Chitinophagaceae bacterium]